MIYTKTLRVGKVGTRPLYMPVTVRQNTWKSPFNGIITKYIFDCSVPTHIGNGLFGYQEVLWSLIFWKLSIVHCKIIIQKSGKCQNGTEGQPFLRKWESLGKWLKWILNPLMSENLLVWSKFIRTGQNFLG